MSAPFEALEPEETFKELLRSRIILHAEHLDGDELLRLTALCIELRVANGSLSV